MQDQKSRQVAEREAKKAERLAEALRANLGKRKALARSKKAAAAESPDTAGEMLRPGTDHDPDAGAS
jgi:hypothetical protein